MYTDAELTMLAHKSDADLEDSCTNAMYQVPGKFVVLFLFFLVLGNDIIFYILS